MRVTKPGPVTSDDRHGHAVEVVHRDRSDEDAVGGPLGAQSVRALSPAVNDPTTTVQALDRIEYGHLPLAGRPSAHLAARQRGPPGSRPRPQWADIVSHTVETFPHRAGHPQIVRRLNVLSTGCSRPCPRTGGLLLSSVRRPRGA
ncbi:DUF2254 family protein [Streptomyces sp. NBC_01727]|uniref:DUF2254 family protein n=1 Tax=Streptomyces sp. NBC_01727 TaxID=2975924 RepID=UPI002E0F4759|nr:DUF2254 domain-containing protein [Streptomyces sp. NBC_01727]